MTQSAKSISDAILPDRYSRNARLYPALLVILPVAICAVLLAKVELSWINTLYAGLTAIGGTYLFAQLARDPGKKREKQLFAKWGGMPSVTILRHQDTRIDPITKARYHERLCALVVGTTAPSAESERVDLAAADVCYTAWSTHLRNSTRDQKRFSLIFDELVSYGYRRNVLGLRPIGLFLSALCGIAAAGLAWFKFHHQHEIGGSVWASLAVAIVFLLFWTFIVTPEWVQLIAESYAARLIEAVDGLHDDLTKAKAVAKKSDDRTKSTTRG
jgi:hypothetical protein